MRLEVFDSNKREVRLHGVKLDDNDRLGSYSRNSEQYMCAVEGICMNVVIRMSKCRLLSSRRMRCPVPEPIREALIIWQYYLTTKSLCQLCEGETSEANQFSWEPFPR